MEGLIVPLSILVIIIMLVSQLLWGSKDKDNYNYKKLDTLFTPAERSFLGVLDKAVTEEYRIFGKVRVADIISPAKGQSRSTWQKAFNRISSKHFDYVLCDSDTLNIRVAIELDDKSHSSKKAKERDALINAACLSAGIILIRFPAQKSYAIEDVRRQITTSFVSTQ
jgi:hypothetical protein